MQRVAYSMSRQVKNIREKLDQVADDATKFGFSKVDRQPIRSRVETCSYVDENRVIGRELDKRRIVDMLLCPNIQGNGPVLAIVGMGGLGKTALAQLVYNDDRIQIEFCDRRFWICVSDQDQSQFNTKTILARIYKFAKGEGNIGDLALDSLVQEVRSILDQNKYLLVLDDVWTEDRITCNELMDILIGSGQMAKRGSRILVTSRSKKTAIVLGCNHPYELQGLSDENSWLLFKIMSGIEQANCLDLVEMGKDIVEECANVPLAIKVIGSFLNGQDKNAWQCIRQRGLSAIRKEENDIMPILKFSYYHLSPLLKTCFAYCALFPKDFKHEKDMLISLWMAHDYIKDEGQGLEAVAEYCFNILVQRCFFQNVCERYDGMVTFTIHDLMHDMAQQVAGKDISIANFATTNLDRRIRHLYDSAPENRTKAFMTTTKIRSYVKSRRYCVQFPMAAFLANWGTLRALDLSNLEITSLPNAIGELLHLRYLDLSNNRYLKNLHKSLTKLINLQFLNLQGCGNLEELPKDFTKLVSLRTLHVCHYEAGSSEAPLRCMPLRMEKMTCLARLNMFVIGHVQRSWKQVVRLEDVRVPRNLRGSLKIYISRAYNHVEEYGGEGGYLCNTEHLKSISIEWPSRKEWPNLTYEEESLGNEEDVLEDLQPHGNLRELEIKRYAGVRFPKWARKNSLVTSLPNLVKIVFKDCDGLKELPWLGKLQHLRTLELYNLVNLKYMENKTRGTSSGSGGAAIALALNSSTAIEIEESSTFYPSLEKLLLYRLPKLKGWWRGMSISTLGSGRWSGMRDDDIVHGDNTVQNVGGHRLPLFPHLSRVTIIRCPNLRSIPLGHAVDLLEFSDFGGCVQITKETRRSHNPKAKVIRTDKVRYLKCLPMMAFQCVTRMEIRLDDRVESLVEVEAVFCGCSSSLQYLKLAECCNLRSVTKGLEHLTALESLHLVRLYELTFNESGADEEGKEDCSGMPWKCLAQCLRSLTLDILSRVYSLPKGMCYLTALRSLSIYDLPLRELPEWIGCLSSLQSLEIQRCYLKSLPEAMRKLTSLIRLEICSYNTVLQRRCENPDGEDWPKIQHIPDARCITAFLSSHSKSAVSTPSLRSTHDYEYYSYSGSESAASTPSLR